MKSPKPQEPTGIGILASAAPAGVSISYTASVAAAFFLSIEFRQTGYFVYRDYEAGLDRRPQYEEFMRDLNAVGLGVEVVIGDWQQRLAQQCRAFAEAGEYRQRFGPLTPLTRTGRIRTPRLLCRGVLISLTPLRNPPGR